MTDKTEWIPEIGQECEYYGAGPLDDMHWCRCKVIAIDSGRVIAESLEGSTPFFCRNLPLTAMDFRPLKTKEDLEREEVAGEIDEALSQLAKPGEVKTIGEVVYDLGYRKHGEVVSVDEFTEEFYKQSSSQLVGNLSFHDKQFLITSHLGENFTITRKVKS